MPAGCRWMASVTAQRSIREPCLVTCPRITLVSDSWCRGVSPAQRAQLPGTGEPADVADLGDDDRGQHRADARQGLDRAVSLMPGQQVGDDLAPAG